ncbi:MAG TPA: hemerythrin domain-containing protein [Ilumatobacteraceae bacterium]|nr:hemerythrin domain-containing protein [Ilumatobacteraceae bacterium]
MKKPLILLVAGGAALAAFTRARRARRDVERASRPADVGFMYAMHAAMRRDLERLGEASRRRPGIDPAPEELTDGWALLRSQLEFHHQAEDEDLWPKLRQRIQDPAQLEEIDEMVREHALIPPALEAVGDALASRADLGPAVSTLTDIVCSHLDHEERSVLPLVERHLTDAEWHDFLDIERGKRTPRQRVEFLGWVLDDATPDDAAPVLAELPAPGRLVYRHIIKPRHDARNLWSTEPVYA